MTVILAQASMSMGDWVAVVMAAFAVAGAIAHGASRISKMELTLSQAVADIASAAAKINETKNGLREDIASLREEIRRLADDHDKSRDKLWEQLKEHEHRLDQHDGLLAALRNMVEGK